MIFLKQVDIHADKFPTDGFYPFNLKLLRETDCIEFDRSITFFIGDNGTGKSTLLKAIARRCGIHIWEPDFRSRCNENPFEDKLFTTISTRWEAARVPGSFFGSQIFSHFARNLEEWALNDEKMLSYFGGSSLITQSHGQSLMAFFKSRYTRKGIYFLDEPETALSPQSLIELLNLLIKIREQGHAQFIIATHSPFLLACPNAGIYSFDNEKIKPVEYQQTSYYQLYKAFMNQPDKFIEDS